MTLTSLTDHTAPTFTTDTEDIVMTTILNPTRSRITRDPRPPGEPEPRCRSGPELRSAGSTDPIEAPIPVARCADGNGTLTPLFFSDHVADIARAKAMCGLCPLQDDCLAGALQREEPWGVWGGELLSGGRIVADKRPCGRPPKHPRPEIVYDELGPVGVVA